ncbi:MAG: hypothetical protein AB7J13_06440 [Pyrinomonadaceae bacterium]
MAEEMARRFREYVQTPVLTDIAIRSLGFETYDVFPKYLPDLLAGRPVIIFGKWRGTPAGTIELSGKTGDGDYSVIYDVARAQPDDANLALKYLWARSRIDELSDYGAFSHNDERVKQITALGLKYGLLTPFTSFVAVHEVIRNPNGDATDVDQPLPMPIGVTDLAIGSEPELVWLFVGFALIAIGFVLRYRWNEIRGLTPRA